MKKRERTQINKIRCEREEMITDTKEIQRMVRKYYEQLYANKPDTTWTKWINSYKHVILPKINQEESENLNRQITPNKIEAVIRKLTTNKCPGPDGFTGDFYQTF